MKKALMIDMLENLARAHALLEHTQSYVPAGQIQSMVSSAKFRVDEVLAVISMELKK